MALKTLPAKWCVLRTAENNGRINQYFNSLRNYSGWYEGEEERYFTVNTEKGNKTGPFKSKPDSYVLITFADFCTLVLGEQSPEVGGRTRLPNFWAVKSDGSSRFITTVIAYLNTLRKPTQKALTGETKFYYGFDGDAKTCFELNEFSKTVELLTIDDFIILHAAKTGKQVEGVSIASKPSKAAPVAARPQEVVDFKLIKKYPGMVKLGVMASYILPSFNGPTDSRCLGDFSDYWEPVMMDAIVVGDYVKVLASVGSYPANSIVKVVGIRADNTSKILTINDKRGLASSNIRITHVKPVTPEERKEASAILINGRMLTITPENKVQFGASTLTRIQLEGLKEFMAGEGTAKITVGNQNIGYDIVESALELF